MNVAPPPHPGDERSGGVLVADVGNSRIKLARVEGWGAGPTAASPPRVSHRLSLDAATPDATALGHWLSGLPAGPAHLLVASVHDAAADRLERAVRGESAARSLPVRCRRIGHADLPVVVTLDAPQRVGIDRLAAAAAAAILRPRGVGAIVVDGGTAVTVDLVDAAGRFLGGAILPGPSLQARALAVGTSLLPEIDTLSIAPPPPMPGRSTRDAIAAGIGWGIRGAVAEVVARARDALMADGRTAAPAVFVTGGWGPALLPALDGAVAMPDLVPAGIATACDPAVD